MEQIVYNLEGKEVGKVKVAETVFGSPLFNELIHQVVYVLNSNLRRNIAHTKRRGEVRGGGKKPWKQKGTGHARAGSIRSPLFRKGGVIFGPRNEINHQKGINKKAKRKAFKSVFSGKFKDKEVFILDDLAIKKPAVKTFVVLREKLGLDQKKVLFLMNKKNANLEKSLRNLTNTRFKLASDVNCLDLLNNRYILLDKTALQYFLDKYK